MRKLILVSAVLAVLALNVNAQQLSLDAMIERDIASWLTTYKNLHAAPELSHREEKTSAFVAGELRKLGFTVTERIGKFQNAAVAGLRRCGSVEKRPRTNSPRQNRARRAASRRENGCSIRKPREDQKRCGRGSKS